MSDPDRCQSCLMAGFDLVTACAFCGTSGCEACVYDGDAMYNTPTCCAEAAALNDAWWALPSGERFKYPRGACAEEMSEAEARALLAKMQEPAKRALSLVSS